MSERTPLNPSGLCLCGCGQPAPVVKRTVPSRGLYAGEHRRYIKGHQWQGYRQSMTPPNPSGLCECGCGQTTPVSKYTSVKDDTIRGEHVRFVFGHQTFKFRDLPEGHRWCRHCNAFVHLDQFYAGGSANRTSDLCKEHRRLYDKTRDRREAIKNTRLRQYRLTIEDYREMNDHQKGLCAICGLAETRRHQNGNLKQLAVDHDHTTGQVRALLCQGCNQGIAFFGEDIPRLQSAIRYLRKFRPSRR